MAKKPLNDRTQWNSSSGRQNAVPETNGPQPIANKDNGALQFRIGPNKAKNLSSGGAKGY